MKPVGSLVVLVFLLTGCGGGGGSPAQLGNSPETAQPPQPHQPPGQETGDGQSGSGSVPTDSIGPVSQTRSAKRPGLSAKGVEVSIVLDEGNIATFKVNRGGYPWTREGFKYFTGGPGNGDWTNTTTKLNDDETQRFRATTDIAESGDMDYIVYGYWSRHPSTSLYHEDSESFYYGSMPYAGNVKNLSGQATYTGNAMGVYRIRHTPGSLRTYGYFEAQVSLTASFGSSGEIVGSMTDIADIEELILNRRNPLSRFGDPSSFTANYDDSGRSFAGDSCGTSGCEWGGYFLGPSGAGQVPTGVAGWFEGLTIKGRNCSSFACSTARLEGSFGAQRE